MAWLVLVAIGLGVGLLRDTNSHVVVHFVSLAGVVLACRLRDVRMLLLAVPAWMIAYWFGVWPGEDARVVVSELALAAILPVMCAVAVGGFRGVAVDLDRAEREAAGNTESLREAAAAANADLDARTTVHDHVLHALLGVAMVDSGGITIAAARSQVARALDAVRALNALPVETDVGVLLRKAADWALPGTRIRGEAPPLPPDVAEAFGSATGEALRNVVRHAGVGDAMVVVSCADETTTVEITDQGKGFDPDQVGSTSAGIVASIRQRMVAVGGTASVTSAPGNGTVVTLGWADPFDQHHTGAWGHFPHAVDARLRRLLISCIAILALECFCVFVAVEALDQTTFGSSGLG